MIPIVIYDISILFEFIKFINIKNIENGILLYFIEIVIVLIKLTKCIILVNNYVKYK